VREVQRACPSIPLGAAMRAPPRGGQQVQEFGIVLGSIPIGTPGFVRGYLNEVVYPRVERDAVAVQDSLSNAYTQQQWLMLYHSTQYTIDYWLQHCAPEDTLELATAFDTLILRLAGAALGQSFNGVEHGVDLLRCRSGWGVLACGRALTCVMLPLWAWLSRWSRRSCTRPARRPLRRGTSARPS
jgi:hypothetical protein